MKEILQRNLPKWPQMLVSGKTIAQEDAMEIIRRTDSFFGSGFGGNDREYAKQLRAITKMPNNDGEYDYKTWCDWKQRWGYLDLEHIHNDWVTSAFIGGPHGWCHPDGSISFCYNVGKWPNGQEIFNDWSKISNEFPFLKLGVILMDRENCENGAKAVIGFKIADGIVNIVDPLEQDVLAGFPSIKPIPSMQNNIQHLMLRSLERERGIKLEHIKKWAINVFGPDLVTS